MRVPRGRLTHRITGVMSVVSLAALLAGCGAAARSAAPLRITIRPATALIDAAPSVVVSGLRSGQTVRLSTSTPRLQNVWTSSATFRANRDGTVDLARALPADHAYDGAASLGLLGVQTPGIAAQPRPGAIVTTFTATAGGRTARATLRQLLRAPDVRVREETVAHDGFFGRLYLPPGGRPPRPAVVVWGGSEGGVSTGSLWAQVIASHGIPALGIAYFDAPGLPCALNDIPLRYFVRAIRWMGHQPGVDRGRIWVLSASRGSEAEALLAAHYPRLVHGFVAAAPSSTAYGSLSGNCQPRSRVAWTFRGRPVPSARIDFAAAYYGASQQDRRAYAATLHTRRTRRALIPISGFRGPALLLSGRDDEVWPSPFYTAQMMRELARDPAAHERRVYPGVGHLVLGVPSSPDPTVSTTNGSAGGTEAADDAAHRADWPLMIAFIKHH